MKRNISKLFIFTKLEEKKKGITFHNDLFYFVLIRIYYDFILFTFYGYVENYNHIHLLQSTRLK